AIRVWDGLTGQPLSELPAGHDWCARVAFQPNGKLLASAAGRSLKLWSPEGKCAYESSDHSSTIADIGWNPEGEGVAVAAYNGVTLHVPGKLDKPRKLTWKGSSLVLRWSP